MIISIAVILTCAAACLATIATAPAALAEVARQPVLVKHHPRVKPGKTSFREG
jgi:hypothetical protein